MDFDSVISLIQTVFQGVGLVISIITLAILAVQLGMNLKDSKKKKNDRQTPHKR